MNIVTAWRIFPGAFPTLSCVVMKCSKPSLFDGWWYNLPWGVPETAPRAATCSKFSLFSPQQSLLSLPQRRHFFPRQTQGACLKTHGTFPKGQTMLIAPQNVSTRRTDHRWCIPTWWSRYFGGRSVWSIYSSCYRVGPYDMHDLATMFQGLDVYSTYTYTNPAWRLTTVAVGSVGSVWSVLSVRSADDIHIWDIRGAIFFLFPSRQAWP